MKNKASSYQRQKALRKSNKDLFIKSLGGQCSRCGYNKIHRALHFHHTYEKKDQISRIIGHSKDKIFNEIQKCELLCSNCHQKEHSTWSKNLSNINNIWHWRKLALYQGFGMQCAVCKNKDPGSFHFHHLNPLDKKFNLSTRKNLEGPPPLIWQEALKCILICSNCHMEIEEGLHERRLKKLIQTAPHNRITFEEWKKLIDRVNFRHEIKDSQIIVIHEIQRKRCLDCQKLIARKAKRCVSCNGLSKRRIEWPPIDELKKMINKSNYHATGKRLGVSCNAVRKHIRKNS